jgi:hypothetical protein
MFGVSGPDRLRVALSFGEAGRSVKRLEVGADAEDEVSNHRLFD